MHILLLEDDSLVRSSLCGVLTEFGRVHPVTSLHEAYEALTTHNMGIALVDRKLPDGDGLELVQHLHDHSPHTKTVLVTSLADLSSRLHGWRSGADDYIAKPFSREEVRLRVARLTKLHKETSSEWETFGALTFNKNNGDVFYGSKPIYLRPKEFEIFIVLWRNRGKTTTKQQLVNSVWGLTDQPNPATLGVYVRRLRMSLRPTGVLVTTVHRHGYMLSAETSK